MIECINLDNYAVTSNASRYNEDSLTAHNLIMRTAKRTKQAIQLLKSLYDGITAMYSNLKAEYVESLEELDLALIKTIPYDNPSYLTRYYFLFNEDAKGLIELAGDINKSVNNGFTAYAEMITQLSNINGIEDKLKELENYVDSCDIAIYDECSYTTLELAGHTAKNVNDFITAVNMLEDIVKFINNSKLTIDYDSDNEMIITVIANDNEEILEI